MEGANMLWLWVTVGVLCLLAFVVLIWGCCVTSGRADERFERMMKDWGEE